MMQIAAYGRLVVDPRPIDTRSGKPMTVARLVVNLQTCQGDDEAHLFLGLVAFGGQAERLALLEKGGMCSVIGRGQMSRWESDQGPREELQVIVDEIVTGKTVRPRTGKEADTQQPPRQAPEPEGLPFNDSIPF